MKVMGALAAIWREPESTPVDVESLNRDPLLAQLLYARGIRAAAAADAFLNPAPLSAPVSKRLPNLAAAVNRIEAALEKAERIAIFGDYDVDGVTSTALLALSLRALASDPMLVSTRLPNRREGYGLSIAAVDEAVGDGAALLITVDCGSSDRDAISRAVEQGLDIVVLDHHRILDAPPANAIVVSAQLNADHDLCELTGAGVAYIVISELTRRGHGLTFKGLPETSLLDLVALGAVADVALMTGVNRALVRDGLTWIRKANRPGVKALLARAQVRPEAVDTEQISFKLVPRLNAAGRLADPALALDLLMATSLAEANRLAEKLEQLNEARRDQSHRILVEIDAMIAARPEAIEQPVLVFVSTHWPAGLVGPAAAKLTDRYRRPAVVLADEGGMCHGSARSIPGFDMAKALAAQSDMLERHGGHPQAAGVTIRRERVEELANALRAHAASLDAPDIGHVFALDADLPLERLDLATAAAIERLQPFGQGNPRPLVRVRNVQIQRAELVGQDQSHLRLALNTGADTLNAIMFSGGCRFHDVRVNASYDIAGHLGIDHWNGRQRAKFEVKDFRPAEQS